jgi:hypothetical protein
MLICAPLIIIIIIIIVIIIIITISLVLQPCYSHHHPKNVPPYYPPSTSTSSKSYLILGFMQDSLLTFLTPPVCHHGMARPQVADGETASNVEGSSEYIE